MATPQANKSATYKIRAQGVVDDTWSQRFCAMTIVVTQDPDRPPVTTLTGVLADQDALETVCDSLYTLGIPLLSVERLGEVDNTTALPGR
jgi:hypothetical protein